MDDPKETERLRRASKKKHKEREVSKVAVAIPSASPLQSSSSKPPTTLVKLNIGGHLFTTTSSTLLNAGDSYFSSMLSGRIPTTKDDAGTLPIDCAVSFAFRPAFSHPCLQVITLLIEMGTFSDLF